MLMSYAFMSGHDSIRSWASRALLYRLPRIEETVSAEDSAKQLFCNKGFGSSGSSDKGSIECRSTKDVLRGW